MTEFGGHAGATVPSLMLESVRAWRTGGRQSSGNIWVALKGQQIYWNCFCSFLLAIGLLRIHL